MTHPARLLWDHFGRPPANVTLGDDGICVICGSEGPVIEAGQVVSPKFTDWDQYAGTAHTLWCEGCVWAHTVHDLRTYAWKVSPTECERLSEGRLNSVLSFPLDHDTAVIIPISRHKHLLPRARAGVITSDDAHLPWGDRQVEFLNILTRLRALGFSENALTEAAPRWAMITKLSGPDKVEVLKSWAVLTPWRNNPLLMAIGLRATRGIPARV